MINVTEPYLPKKKDFIEKLNNIWNINHLTNNGPQLQSLEGRIKAYLNQKNDVVMVANGTIGLQIALKCCAPKGEVITTPFTYIATSSATKWEGYDIKFVDIDPRTFNIDPLSIEKTITKKTKIILVTHVFGNPADIKKIETIAKNNNLKVIYDSSHSFDVQYDKKSINDFGFASVTSTHATKIFHTVEGGLISSANKKLINQFKQVRNFCHRGEKFTGVGINAKNSEIHSAMGHCVLDQMDKILAQRKKQYNKYLQLLNGNKMIQFQKINEQCTKYNYSYFPIVFSKIRHLQAAIKILNLNNIFPRRYFYPSLNTLIYFDNKKLKYSEELSKKILCLPLFHKLKLSDIKVIANLINEITRV